MANICFVVTSLNGGGAERNVSILSNHFVKLGHKVKILVLLKNGIFYEFNKEIEIINLVSNKKGVLSKVLYWKKCISKFVRDNNVDVVIGIGIRYGMICGLSLLRNRKTKLIVRGTSTYKLPLIDIIICKLFGRRCDTFVLQTEAQATFVPKNLRKKAIVISNPFHIYTENNNMSGYESKRFISVGRLEECTKQQSIIIKAFSKFKTTDIGKEFKLSFYGSGNNGGEAEKYLLDLISELNVNDIELNPACKDVLEKIKNSYCFICSSVIEGMPNALIESLMIGIPCITSSWLGSKEIIKNNLNGLCYGDSRDVDSLVNEMIKAASMSKEQYLEMSNCAYQLNSDKYSEELIINKWNALVSTKR